MTEGFKEYKFIKRHYTCRMCEHQWEDKSIYPRKSCPKCDSTCLNVEVLFS